MVTELRPAIDVIDEIMERQFAACLAPADEPQSMSELTAIIEARDVEVACAVLDELLLRVGEPTWLEATWREKRNELRAEYERRKDGR
jgi:hypothetical protein